MSNGSGSGVPAWRQAEQEYEDDLREHGTIPELFADSAQRHADQAAQLYKGGVSNRSMTDFVPEPPADEYGSITYQQLHDIVKHLAAGLRDIGLDHGDCVGIFADTRMEWAQADLGVLAAGGVATTVYTDSSAEQAEYLLDDPDATGVVVEDDDLLETVLAVEDNLNLSWIVVVDETDHQREDIHTLGEVHERGRDVFDPDQYAAWLDETEPTDLASIIYTSGTTGRPKGVRLTHWNFRSNVHQIRRRVGPRPDQPERFSVGPGTVSVSFLPLAHVLERLAGHFLMLSSGATVGYAESPDTLADDLKQIRPHTGVSVPRVYERIFNRMRTQAQSGPLSGLTKRIFEWSLGVARQHARADDPGRRLRVKHALADRLVYSTVKDEMGGRLECMVSGGGSLSEDLARLFKGMGVPILEGYGLTETSPVVSVNTPDDVRPGTLGPPLEGVEIAFDESPSVGTGHIDAKGRVGELLVRGDNVSDGYWNQPGATKRAFTDAVPSSEHAVESIDASGQTEDQTTETGEGQQTDDGQWFRTGDLIEQTPDGFLVFHERLKQLFVLTTGKNVAPGPIEDRFATSDRIQQIMVVGDDEKFVGALVVPDFERLATWAQERGYELPENRELLIEDERVNAWVGAEIDQVNENLERIEQIKQFALVPEEWSAENDMLTPSMKKKRRNILDSYDDLVTEIYEE